MANRSVIKLKLHVEHPTQNEQFELPLLATRPLVIGRSPTADVVVKSTSVSREHCKLLLIDGAINVEDLGSTSGTHYYGEKIEGQRRLADGDTITLGPASVRIVEVPEFAVDPPETGGNGRLTKVASSASSAPGSVQPPPRQWQNTMMAGDAMAMEAMQATLPPVEKITIELNKNELVIGTAAECDVVLSHVMISRRHARVRRLGQAWFIEDLGSTNGTYVNGIRLRSRHALDVGDTVKIGPHELRLDGNVLTARSLEKEGITILAHDLTKEVVNRSDGQTTRLLNGVSFVIRPGEFVGLLGPSGCGKSTLMDALNGRRPTNAGFVFYNNDDLYKAFESFKSGIGYVPQDVIFHKALTVREALRYISRLRLPTDSTDNEIESNIDRVLQMVGLGEREKTVIRDLSGGQKKRVSLAIELISRPSILFLDEVTSGLDVASEREVMDLLRKLADGGLTIICITHFVDSLDRCDKLACLMRGRLVYYGSPINFRTHFGVKATSEVYSLEKQRSPEQWQELFQRSIYYTAPPGPPEAIVAGSGGGRWFDVDRFRSQVATLTKRYVRLMTVDRAMPTVLISLAPIIAILLCILTSPISYNIDQPHSFQDLVNYLQAQSILSFGAVLTVMFLSMFGSVQEVVKESRIYRHERSNNLMIVPYMISKLVPLSIVGAIQSVSVCVVLYMFGHLRAGNIIEQMMLLLGVSWVGTLLGLLISTAVPSGTQGEGEESGATLAVTLMNAIVIPELLFSGGLAPLSGISKLIGQSCIAAYWGFQGFLARVDPVLSDKLKLFDVIPGFDMTAATKQLISDPPSLTFCLTVLSIHWVVACILWFILLLRKDGHDAFKRLYRSLPRDPQGRISTHTVLSQTGQLIGVKKR